MQKGLLQKLHSWQRAYGRYFGYGEGGFMACKSWPMGLRLKQKVRNGTHNKAQGVKGEKYNRGLATECVSWLWVSLRHRCVSWLWLILRHW